MKVGILGAGFGLYGYLPALMQIPGVTIQLPVRYQERLKARTDICRFFELIEWVFDENSLLSSCEALVIALPPVEQYYYVKKCLTYDHITHLLLEKPLAQSPVLAQDLMDNLLLSNKKFRIGYNFRYTDWGKTALKSVNGIKNIIWNFKAHHNINNIKTWKRDHHQGGGVLRFYGIHFIALLAELGYSDAVYSESNHDHWLAEFSGQNLISCKISIDSNCDNAKFIVMNSEREVCSIKQPFQKADQQEVSASDQRVPYLIDILAELFTDTLIQQHWYPQVNQLWMDVEKRTHML